MCVCVCVCVCVGCVPACVCVCVVRTKALVINKRGLEVEGVHLWLLHIIDTILAKRSSCLSKESNRLINMHT